MIKDILKKFGIDGNEVVVQAFGSGLINHTWLVQREEKKYILQKINKKVFNDPAVIDHNLRLLSEYLTQNYKG